MKKILLYIILFLSGIDGAWALPIEKEGMSIYSPSLKQEVSYSIILPEGYEHSETEYPVLYMFHGIGGDYTSWLEYGNVARVMDKMIKEGKIQPFIMVIPDGYLSYYSDTYDGSSLYETFFIKELVPYIDNNYRTRKDINGRSIIGFSMGGFGALSVSLRNRHLFGSVVALSPSIRTEKQYMEEGPQKGWDNQWGRIFGGVGKNGNQRLTSYYKQHSPYHILSTLRNPDLKGFGIMLDIGDKEGTLCESNEELHRLLLERQIPHEWEVRSGGHDFACWNTALPKAFRFINEYFNGKQSGNSESSLPNETPFIQTANATVYYPEQAQGSTRKYPIIYVQGEINEQQQKVLVSQFHQMVDENKTWPAVLCFVKANTDLSETISDIEKQLSGIRGSQRMRALINPAEARKLLGTDKIIGVTAKTVEQAKRAEADGADYLGSGAVFGSTTKLNAKPMTKELLREITAAVDIPVVAIGGINADNAVTLKGTGIAGIAVVGAIFASADIKAAAKELAEICDKIL